VPFFAEAEHQAGFRGHVGMRLFCPAEKFERALIDGALAHLAVKAGHGFRIVIQHVGPDGKNRIECIPVASKIRNQDFHLAARNAAADFFDGARKNLGATVRLVVAVDAGNDGVAKAHAGDGFGNSDRLFFIRRTDRLAGGNGAEAAGARANIAKDHEGCGAVLPAFAHVGAAGAFAHGVKVEGAHDALEILVAFAAEKFDAKPVWARVGSGRRDEGRSSVGDDVKRGSHSGRGLKSMLLAFRAMDKWRTTATGRVWLAGPPFVVVRTECETAAASSEAQCNAFVGCLFSYKITREVTVLRTIAAVAAVASSLGLGVSTRPQQSAAASAVQKEKAETCRISGTVLKFVEGTPLKGATVWLENDEDHEHTIAPRPPQMDDLS
jgi:hypothetical protein